MQTSLLSRKACTAHRARATGVVAESPGTPAGAPTRSTPQEAWKPVDRRDAVLLQGFGWDSHKHKGGWYKHLQRRVADMQAEGITHLWLPPPSVSVSPQGYLPGQLYNLNSAYGNRRDLEALISDLKAAGISPLADIVINHRCADAQDEQGRWNNFHDQVTHDGHNIDWGRWAITCDDPVFGGTGNRDTGADFHGAPDLDHANEHLREALCEWLQFLQKDVGFDSWRLDFVKGYGASFITQYVDESVGAEAFNIGELWVDLHWENGGLGPDQGAARQAICDWIDGTQRRSCAFDFVTKGILQEAVKNCEYWRLRDSEGRAPGLLGLWPGRAVTFVDNHDTGSSQQHWPFPTDRLGAGHAYILTHPGAPCLFYEHYFDGGNDLRQEIKRLTEVRKRAGIRSDSKLRILCADADMYVAAVGERLVIKMGPRYDMGALLPKKEQGWEKAASGKDYAVWVKGE